MGGIMPSQTTKTEIGKIIEELRGTYHSSGKKEFDIEDIDYEIIIESICIKGGYPELSIKASGVPYEDKFQIEKIVFFSESISIQINNTFSKINDLAMFNEVIRIYVKFVLIHELVHVLQIKNGMTKENYYKTSYEKNIYEKEANEKAVEFINREGDFQSKIAEIIVGNKSVDYDTIMELKKLYSS